MDNNRSEISTEVRELRARAAEQLVGNEYYMIAQQLDSLENSPELTGETAQSVLEMLRTRLGSAEPASAAADSDAAAPAAAAPESESAHGDTDYAVVTPRANSFGTPQATGALSFTTEPEADESESQSETPQAVSEAETPAAEPSRLQAAVAATHRLATEHLDGNSYYMAAKMLDGLRDLPAVDRKGASIMAPENLGDAVVLLRQEIEQLDSLAKDQAAPIVASLQALFAPAEAPEASAGEAAEDAVAAARRETMEALDSLQAEEEAAPAGESAGPETSPSEPAADEQVVSIAQPALDAAAAAKRDTMEALASLRADLEIEAEKESGTAEETAPEPAGSEEAPSVVEAVVDAAAAAKHETMEALSGLRANDDAAPADEIAEPETAVVSEEPAVSEDATADRQETMASLASLRGEPEAEVSDDSKADDQVEPAAATAEVEPEPAAAQAEPAEPEEEPEAEPEPGPRTGFDDLAEAAWQRVREVGYDDVASPAALNGSAVHASVVAPSPSPAPEPAPAAPPPPPAASMQETAAPSAVSPVVEETPAAPAAAPDVEARETDEALNDGGSERRSSQTDDTAEHDVPAAASGDPEPAAETAAAETSAQAGEAAPPAETVAVETPEPVEPRNAETPASAAETASAAIENIARTQAPLVADEDRVAPDAEPGGVATEAVETANEASAEAVAAIEAAIETVAEVEAPTVADDERVAPDAEPGGVAAQAVETASEAGAEAVAAVEAAMETVAAADAPTVAETTAEPAPEAEKSAEPAEVEPVAEEPAVSPVETVAAEAAAQQAADTAPSPAPETPAASAEPKPPAPEAQKQPEKPAKKGFFARLFGG